MEGKRSVPALAAQSVFEDYPKRSALFIGENEYKINWRGEPPSPSRFLSYLIISLKDLSIAENETSYFDELPKNIASYAGSNDHILYFSTQNFHLPGAPAGDVLNFLKEIGSGARLTELENIRRYTGTEYFDYYGYMLLATLAKNDAPGIERLSLNGSQYLYFEFRYHEHAGYFPVIPT